MRSKHLILLRFLFWCISVCLIFASVASAQQRQPVRWYVEASAISNNEAVITFTALIDHGWWIYSNQLESQGPVPTFVEFNPSADFELLGTLEVACRDVKKFDPGFRMEVSAYERKAVFTQRIKLHIGTTQVTGSIIYTPCTDQKTLRPEEEKFSVAVRVKERVKPETKTRPSTKTIKTVTPYNLPHIIEGREEFTWFTAIPNIFSTKHEV